MSGFDQAIDLFSFNLRTALKTTLQRTCTLPVNGYLLFSLFRKKYQIPLKAKMIIPLGHATKGSISYLEKIRTVLGIDNRTPPRFAESLPFSSADTTAGAENELQAVVIGSKNTVDLPRIIEASNYYQNIIKRILAGETSRRIISDIEKFIASNREGVWENSWVRISAEALTPCAREGFYEDLQEDKTRRDSPRRSDVHRFVITDNGGEQYLRIPLSYLLKLSFADALSSGSATHPLIGSTGSRLMKHFLNDNTSPEQFSFHPVVLSPENGMGRMLGRETAKRFFLTQLLTYYANKKFHLSSSGQETRIYCAPHPPIRQKQLNNIISDSFYRELFMSPCLSGWDKGEEKYRYMVLCHQVLSRSQLNALGKLKEAGIITNNLVTLPSVSNISLANNGTHVSLGSRSLTTALSRFDSHTFLPEDEKYIGDLVIKIVEHFLPLFVGTYSAAPYRLDFQDFHPEKALGFLPHELDYTHIRMIWRRWMSKTKLKIFGRPITPFGPRWLDNVVAGIFRFKGDLVPDFRLIDYLAVLMSTDQSPALDGSMGNQERLKQDLADLGIFDSAMSLYLLYKMRDFKTRGFSGFEGRHYSLFLSFLHDMGPAVSLQTLITALAFKYAFSGAVTHAHIPDNPFVESERRQIFFGAAIGIPTFFVRRDTKNLLMKNIIEKTKKTRLSRRYSGFLRIYNYEYCRALIRILQEDAGDLIEIMGLENTLADAKRRLKEPMSYSVSGKLTGNILEYAHASSLMKLSGNEFNAAAEGYYRDELRLQHMAEGCRVLEEDVKALGASADHDAALCREAMAVVLDGKGLNDFLQESDLATLNQRASEKELRRLIQLVTITIHYDMVRFHQATFSENDHGISTASVH